MIFRVAALLVAGLFIFSTVADARVDLLPRRVILESRERNGDMTLLNFYDQPSTIRIALLNYRQNEDGTYTTLDGALNPLFDPETLVRLSPRQFTLTPNGRQIVRFSIRRPADLPDGEYRFHIRALRISEYGPPAPVTEGVAVGMTMNVGASIPVIVRHGALSASATLSDPAFNLKGDGGLPELQVTIHREGNASVIGTLRAYWYPQGGEPVEIGVAGNMNVFPEIDRRYAKIPLTQTPKGRGTIRVIYTNDEANNATFAEVSLPL